MRAKLKAMAYIGDVLYHPGIHDFPEDANLPSNTEIVDEKEVEADLLEEALGERKPIPKSAYREATTLSEMQKRRELV